MELQDIDWADGSDNTAGIQQNVYYAKLSDIATLPKPIVDDSTGEGALADLVTISSDITMKSGKVFKKLYCTLEAGGLNGEVQGDLDGKSYKNSLKIFHPGSKLEALGFAQYVKNGNMIFLVPEADGQVRILGHAGYPAKLDTGSSNTGEKSTDRKGNEFVFMSVRKGPAPAFTGKVILTGSGVGSGLVDANSNSYQDIVFIPGS